MSDDNSGSSHQDGKSWLDKLTNAFSSDPETREELLEVLREAHNNKIIDSEALEIIEGALEVSEQQARDIMIPRSHMECIKLDASAEDVLSQITETGHSRFPVVSESADFTYKCTDFYAPDHERTILWNDVDLSIDWPVSDPTISEKDAAGSTFADADVFDQTPQAVTS